MPSSSCVDTILGTLGLALRDPELSLKASEDMEKDTKKLKRDLRFLRTFFLCAKKWSNHVSVKSSLSNIELSISQEFQSLCLKFDMKKAFSEFRETICSFKDEINRLYRVLCLLQSSSISPPDSYDVIELLVSLLKNIADTFTWAVPYYEQELIKVAADLEETVNFMTSFIRFARRGVKRRELEPLLIHFELVAVNAACYSYLCWFDSKCDIWRVPNIERRLKISELRQSIRPVDAKVLEIYVQVLKASNLSASSRTPRMEMDKDILGDFVHSLMDNLWEQLKSSSNDMFFMQKLYEGLTFLKTILKMELQEFDKLDYKIKDLIESVANKAGIIISQLSVYKMTECFIDLEFMEKIELIKVEIAEKHPAISSTLKFPRSNELSFIDNRVDHLNELQKCKVDASDFGKDRIAMVQEGLEFLRSFLNNSMELHNENKNLQTLLSHIIKVTYKAESIVNSLMVEDIPDSSPLLLDTIIEEILLVKIKALEFDYRRYDFEVLKSTKTSSPGISRGCVPIINDVVVGFHDEANMLTDRLTRGSKQLNVIAIVGMPGLGKTTLAHKVFNDPSVICHFHIRAWCFVSQRQCLKDILLDILACIVPDLHVKHFELTEIDLSEQLYRRLKGNRYLVVLDDVWDSKTWNGLERSFPDDANGSRTLLTTRLLKLASEIKPNSEPHFLRHFTDDESWELLQKKLFFKEAHPSALSLFGKQLAKNCNGLPLAVVIAAGILANTKQDDWEAIAKRISSSAICGTDHCMNMLELSYENLPDHLKQCWLYFGTFREDEEIPTWKLMRLWIAEGFVQKNEQISQEDLAEDYVMDLVSRSLLMVTKQRSSGGVKTCRMHDLLHEFCVTKAKEKTFLHSLHGKDVLHNFNGPFNLHRLCIYSKPEHFEKSRLFGPRLHSLLFSADGEADLINWSNVLFLFRIFKLLGVLDLGTIDLGEVFPSEILLLVGLKYLSIAGRMQSIPSTFSNLKNLETFLVEGCHDKNLETFLVEGCHERSLHFRTSYFGTRCFWLPVTIWDMKKLRYLQASGTFLGFSWAKDNLENFPDVINLHIFIAPIFSCGNDMENKMRRLPNIRRLKCKIEESPAGCSQIVAMDFLSQLECLKVCLPNQSHYHTDFRFPSSLTKLTLCHFSWITISRIGELPNLKVLKLVRSRGGNVWDINEVVFPKLRILKLYSLRIVRWTGWGDHFPCLQKLVLHSLHWLKEVPSCLGCVSTLDRIELRNCSKSVERLMWSIQEEQIGLGNEDLKILEYRS